MDQLGGDTYVSPGEKIQHSVTLVSEDEREEWPQQRQQLLHLLLQRKLLLQLQLRQVQVQESRRRRWRRSRSLLRCCLHPASISTSTSLRFVANILYNIHSGCFTIKPHHNHNHQLHLEKYFPCVCFFPLCLLFICVCFSLCLLFPVCAFPCVCFSKMQKAIQSIGLFKSQLHKVESFCWCILKLILKLRLTTSKESMQCLMTWKRWTGLQTFARWPSFNPIKS